MQISKTEVIEAIKAMPQEEFSDIDDLLEELILVEKIKKGLNDMENGNVYSEEEAHKIMDSWQ